jgi:HSP20 family molecular chaperone IbpA
MAERALRKNGPATLRDEARAGDWGPQRLTFTPRADILETAEGLRLVLDMPGARPEDVDLRFERGELTVHGRCEPPAPAGRLLAAEYEVGDYYRAFLIGQDVDAGRIGAEMKNGVLTVLLPKAESAKARRIAVQGS